MKSLKPSILIQKIKTITSNSMFKELFIEELLKVQPMTMNTGQVFTLNNHNSTCYFCGKINCGLMTNFVRLCNFLCLNNFIGYREFHLIIKSSCLIQIYSDDILLVECNYKKNTINYYFNNREDVIAYDNIYETIRFLLRDSIWTQSEFENHNLYFRE